METMSQGHTPQSQACQGLSGPRACQREAMLAQGLSSGLINGVQRGWQGGGGGAWGEKEREREEVEGKLQHSLRTS